MATPSSTDHSTIQLPRRTMGERRSLQAAFMVVGICFGLVWSLLGLVTIGVGDLRGLWVFAILLCLGLALWAINGRGPLRWVALLRWTGKGIVYGLAAMIVFAIVDILGQL